MSTTEKKPGVYLCGGCGIKEAISLDSMKNVATLEMGVSKCSQSDAFCTGAGYEEIKKDVESGEVNQVIISGCSPRVMVQEFNALGTQIFRANIREQVLWTQNNEDEEDTQMFADDNLRMACAQAQKSDAPEKHWGGVESVKLLVVGGGVSGLTAAKEAAAFGVDVTLVEKADSLGGWGAKWSKTIPHKAPYRGLQDGVVAKLIKEVEGNDAITIRTNTIVNRTEGQPGRFTVNLKNGSSDDWEVFGSIVVATGWREWDTSKLEYLGYGKKGVMTDVQFEERLTKGDTPKIAAFIIPNNEEMMPFSSGVTTKVAIKQAVQVMDADPDAMCYVLYEDLRAHGMAEEFYREAQEKGVIFQRGEIKSVGDDLTVTVHDDMLEEDIPMSGFDTIVITTGMVPNTTNIDIDAVEEGASLLVDDINPTTPFDFIKPENGEAGDEESDQPEMAGGPILNLQYKQGPHLPVLANGFADSHYICFPYETRRTGIHTCGPVRRPMTIGEAIEDAQGATLKAIQAMRAANVSEAVHPRAGDLSFPNFGFDICTKCKRCTIECPFSAIDEDPETGYPKINPSRCRRCGTCMGACPVRTITFTNYNPQMVSEMIGVVEMPDEFDEKPRILVLACENDAYPALDMAGINRQELNPYMRFIPVRCLGSVTLLWISTALEKGYDGVMLMGCKSGDDYQCHFVKGSGLAEERMSKVGDTLQSLMLEPERVSMMEVSIADSANITERLNKFSAEIVEIGLNPFK